ncbi:MAG TPA: META domain-containing protein [Candidatus Limnocylindria bacterium]
MAWLRRSCLLLLAVVLAACGTFGPDSAELDGDWVLRSGSLHGQPLPLMADRVVTLRIDSDEVGGTAACNVYGGTIERSGSSIAISALSMTEMGCDEPTLALESAYLAALVAVTTADRAESSMLLEGPDVELIFALAVPEPDASLVGTTWSLESLVSGDAVSSVLAPATLVLEEDGTMRGSTGCRDFTARYELGGADLRVSDLAADQIECDEGMASQDAHVLATFDGQVRLSIEGSRLSISGTDRGLDYLAGS